MQINTKLLEDNVVTTAKINDLAVEADKLATDSVTSTKIVNLNVTEIKLANGAVTNTKLGADAVDGDKIADNSIDSEHYVAASIDGEHLSTDAKETVLSCTKYALFNTILNFTANGSSDDITEEVMTALTVKKFDGDSSNEGLIDTAPSNKCTLRDNSTGDTIEVSATTHIPVNGRINTSTSSLTGTLTFSNGSANVSGSGTSFTTELSVNDWICLDADGVYYKIQSITDNSNLVLTASYNEDGGSGSGSEGHVTINYEYHVGSGIYTPYTFSSPQAIDIRVPESYNLCNMPLTAFISGEGFVEILSAEHIHDDRYYTETEMGATSGTTGADLVGIDNSSIIGSTATDVQTAIEDISQRYPRRETLTPTAQDTIPNMTYTPIASSDIELSVQGVLQRNGTDYTVSGKSITWSFANSGFHVETTDDVQVRYHSSD